MRVKWLQKALRNLDAEGPYVAADDDAAAPLVVTRVMAAIDALADQPNLGRPGRMPGTRELMVRQTRYVVPHRMRGETAELLGGFYASRRRQRGPN